METLKEIKEYIINNLLDSTAAAVLNCEDEESLKEIISVDYEWFRFGRVFIPDGYYKSNRYEFTIVDGKLEGEYNEWHENGQLWVHCFYKKGKRHGELKDWDYYGQLREHSFYKEGKLDGEYKSWYDNGEPFEICMYKEGELVETIV
jgi:antitoxin component YwqK of YwqJK toxin-antitoxin module